MKIEKLESYGSLTVLVGIILIIATFINACSTPSIESPLPQATFENNPSLMDTPTQVFSSPTSTIQNSPTPIQPTLEPTPQDIPTPTEVVERLGIGSTRISEVDGMEQVYVPAGEFIMGSDDPEAKKTIEGGRAYPENPQHVVYLDGYWIDKYEVTNAQYALCVEAGDCEPPFVSSNYTYTRYYGNPEFDNYPVVWVSWYQAREYCDWAGRRLPNEAEWEKASRGTDGQKYPWGEEPVTGERANFCDTNCTRTHAYHAEDDGYPDTSPVGSYPAGVSPYGAMDMSGNVWEWVSSLIMDYPYDANDGREDPDAPGERAWRGGPWSNGIWWMRSSVRYRSVSEYKWYNLGIRCAASETSQDN
jgi:eukaryotic-like serine/threonine-protein kinase